MVSVFALFALVATATAASELQFKSSGSECSMVYDGSSLSTDCATGSGFADTTLRTEVDTIKTFLVAKAKGKQPTTKEAVLSGFRQRQRL